MLKKTLTAALLGSALIAAPALAQNNPPASGQSAAAGNWVQQMKPGQWRASKLHDINVYNNNNEKIGEIDDIPLDQSGKAEVVVIEVGGFLGLGKHTVAMPYSQIKFTDQPRDSGRTAAGGNNASNTTGAGPGTPAPAVPGGDAARGDRPAAGGATTADNRAAANRDNNNARDRGYPDHAVLNMTKDQLKAAPEFKWSANR